MFRKALLTGITLVLIALSSNAAAQSVQEVSCVDRSFGRLFEADIARLGLTASAVAFSAAVYSVRSRAANRDISVIITDCSRLGRSIVVREFMPFPSLSDFGGLISSTQFGLYVSVAFIRNTPMLDLVRAGRRYACKVHSGDYDSRRMHTAQDNPSIGLRCMHRGALVAGDAEYARWLERLIDEPRLETSIR